MSDDVATFGMPRQDALSPEAFGELTRRIETAVGAVIIGQHALVRDVLTALLAGGNVLLEGVPGLGKTLLVRTLADALELTFSRIQFTPDLMPSDIVGTTILDEHDGHRSFRFAPGPVFANLVLADEINRATPKTQSALLEAMQERAVTVGGDTRALPAPFVVLATQNPIEMAGTYPLPEAQLDRFLFKLKVPFPSSTELRQIAELTTGEAQPRAARVAGVEDVLSLQRLARRVPIAPHVTEHAVRLVEATHPDHPSSPPEVRRFAAWGASPRAAQALVLAGKVRALLDGRFNVSAADLDALALAVLRHRIVLNFEARADGIDADDVVAAALASARVEA